MNDGSVMMNFYKNVCGRKGFTLIELVAVTAMLGNSGQCDSVI